MQGWRIKSWDRARARGVITSEHLGDLTFDGAVAMVDDFVADEPVHVELEREHGPLRVKVIWPDDPRFVPPVAAAASAPQLRRDLAARVEQALADLPVALDYRIASLSRDLLVIEGDDDAFADGAEVELRLAGVEYLELPAAWDGKSFRLASPAERSYLATRSQLRADTIALRIVDDARRVFFVTCAGVERRAGRRHQK